MRISDWSSDVCSSDLIAVHVGHGCVVVADELNMRKPGANQPVHPLAQLVNIEGRLTQRLALRGYQPIDQAGQAIGLGNDDLRVLVQIIRTQLHVQKLRGPTYPTQRIFDLVGEIAQGLSLRGQLIAKLLMAIQQNMELDHANLQQGSPGLTMQGHNGQADRYLLHTADYRQDRKRT